MSDNDTTTSAAVDTGQTEREYPSPPPGVRVLANGAGLDIATGKMCAPPGTYAPDTGTAITSQNAAIMARKRWDMARRAAAEGIIAAARLRGAPDDIAGAWSLVVQRQAELALDSEKGRASTEAAKFIARAAGLIAERGRDDDAAGTAASVTPAFAARFAAELAAFLAEQRGAERESAAGDVIDAAARDAG